MPDIMGPTDEDYARLFYEGFTGESIDDLSPEEREEALKEIRASAKQLAEGDRRNKMRKEQEMLYGDPHGPTEEDYQELWYGVSDNKENEGKHLSR